MRTRRFANSIQGPLAAALIATASAILLGGATAALAKDAPKVLRVGTSGDYTPFSSAAPVVQAPLSPKASKRLARAAARSTERGTWTLAEQKRLVGFDIALARLFATERGYRAEFIRFPWPDLTSDLVAGRFDVAMSGVTVRPERSVAGRFTIPVAATHAVAITWKGSGAEKLEDLNRPTRTIAVNAGGHLERVARETFRRADIVALADNSAVRMALLDRAFDAIVTDNFEARTWTAPARNVLEIGPLSDDRKAFFLRADAADLAGELDRWILAKEKDGTLAKLRSKYFQGDGPTAEDEATAEPLLAFGEAVLERLALMPLVYDAKKRAGLAIEDTAREQDVLAAAQSATARAAEAAGGTPPNPEAVRRTFEVLMAMGKDVQARLVERDARHRTTIVVPRKPVDMAGGRETSPAEVPASKAAEVGATENSRPEAADSPSTLAKVEFPEVHERADARERLYDLTTELRPAIGRITDKIARTLVALPPSLSLRQTRDTLWESWKHDGVDPARIDALALALSDLSRSAR